MKISINGNIIETEDIYRISEITSKDKDHISNFFTIYMFNNQILQVSNYSGCYIDNNYISINNENTHNTRDITKLKELFEKLNKECLNKIIKTRQDIVDIWSNNQSNIPKFEL
jgi:hypothetical protein